MFLRVKVKYRGIIINMINAQQVFTKWVSFVFPIEQFMQIKVQLYPKEMQSEIRH